MKIAIAGYGVEGEANYRYWNQPGNELTIVDEREPSSHVPEGAKVQISNDVFASLEGFDLVIRTAGLAPHKIKTTGKIWSATNEFFAHCPAPIIGITGSKGKGTTASLVAEILRATGKTVWLVGNIGVPGLDVLEKIEPSDIVVYELSSFQLWDVEFSPHIAVVLYIEQEHLDVHKDMAEYVAAKAHITRFQTEEDWLIYNDINQYSIQIAASSVAQKIGYPTPEAAHVDDGNFYYGEHIICSTDILHLPGVHNLENACAAIDAVWPLTQDIEAIKQGLGAFRGLPHRLKYVREVNGVKYYDDSIATTPGSAIAALRAFPGRKIIILGGSFKGSDFTELARELTRHNARVLLIGDEAKRLEDAFQATGFTSYELIAQPTMQKIVSRAHDLARSGDVVLLSPAAASFGLFKNYADRGDQFIASVSDLR